MNKRSNPFFPQHNNPAYQRPPLPPGPAPPSQPYDYNYWTTTSQTGQPPHPPHPPPPLQQPGAPIPQWAATTQPHPGIMSNPIPPGQTALYANYGYGGARQPFNWQRPPIPPQQPRQQHFPVPQPPPPQVTQTFFSPQPQPHISRIFPSISFSQNQSNFRSQQPMFQPPPPQHSPPHLPPAKRPRFEGPSGASNGSQSQNTSSQGFGRGSAGASGSFAGSGRVPTGPSRGGSSSRGRGAIGGGPSIGMMRVGGGMNQSNRGGAGGGGGGGNRGGGGGHGSRGGQIGGHRGGRGNWHAQGHSRRGGGGGGSNAGTRGRGGGFSHSGGARQNGSMNTSEKERSSGKKEDPKQTLTDFKIIGLEIESISWKWGICNSEDSQVTFSGDPNESDSKRAPDKSMSMSNANAVPAADEPKLELSDRVEEIEFGAALKEKEEHVIASSTTTAINHLPTTTGARMEKSAKSSSSTSQSPPRIRIYFNTPVITEDVQRSDTSVSNRSKRRMPADEKDDEGDERRRIRAKLNPTSEESSSLPGPGPSITDMTKDRDSAPPSIDASVTSIRSEDEGDWLMEAIAKDGDGSEEVVPPGDENRDNQEDEDNPCDADDEIDPIMDVPEIEGDDLHLTNGTHIDLPEEHGAEEIQFEHEHGEEEIDPILTSQIEPPPSSIPSAADPAEDVTHFQTDEALTTSIENQFTSGTEIEPSVSPVSQQTSQQSLSQTLHSSTSSSTIVSTNNSSLRAPSVLGPVNTEKTSRIPSANRISILYASGTRRLAIDSEVVEAIKICRGRGRIDIVLRLERAGEMDLKGLFPEIYLTESQSFVPSSFAIPDELFPPWSQLIIPSQVALTVHLDKERPLSEPRWVKTGDLEEWLRNTFGIFWVSGEDGWEKRTEVVDPDPPPTIHTVLENWGNGSLVGLETERQRFIKTHMSESDNLLEILLRLVRGERATPLSFSNNNVLSTSNLHLSGPLLTALSPNSPHAGQQTHLTLAIVAMVRMAESFALRSLPTTEEAKREVDEKVGEIIRCLPQHLLFKSLDGIFREWKDTRKRGGR
ncbi:hypothetical protein Clacol_001597 [Clathrus columnatus]|uniref:Uncharacterized protein n=1 Tax=Clathrus columnatus TaxID=1419009 RepID=A0AAV4ZZM1_9AGAM|nr:hypothetical protein Clacol_001597 [Clathrus columnatus]